LAAADVVVYDYLANPRLLVHCPDAQKLYVGKKAAAHTLTQDEINALLVKLGLEGKKVVRLKGGDPFVFGRGGEECLALKDAGVPFEVVPGITAAIGGPAYAGIPVTHRDFNSSFTFITGHEKEEEYKDDEAKARGAATGSSDLDWSVIAKLPCISFYMGVKALPRICAKLIEHGMDPNTPAATIRWGTRPNQQTVAATIATLPQAVVDAGLKAPAMTIIGRVVSLRDQMNWFERRPLFGKTIVVTRTRSQASELSAQLEELGANVIEAPTIETRAPADPAAVDVALTTAGGYDWVVFTSAAGVAATKARLLATGRDVREFGKARIAVIGEATAAAVRDQLGLKVDLCPAAFVAEALADELAKLGIAGKKYLLLRADIARPLLAERLVAAGGIVADVAVYETVPAESLPQELLDALDDKAVDIITFTSSSTAKNLVALLGKGYYKKLAGVQIVSIGPVTSQTLRDLGLPPTIEAKTFNIEGMIAALSGR
jgi:uroporphyrinogen III methyltransferase/synthase